MGFAERLQNIVPLTRGSKCLTCFIISGLPDLERDAVNLALDDPTITHAAMWRVFKAEGYSLSTNALRRHRLKECIQR